MTALRVLLVDDERPARARLRRLLQAEPGVEIVGEAGDGKAAVGAIRKLRPDVVLLDVQMPGLDGFGVVAALGDNAPQIVFVTAHDAFAVRAFEIEALDYLLKPVSPERLGAALARARRPKAGAANGVEERLDGLLRRLDGEGRLRHLLVHDGEDLVFVRLDQVTRIVADRNYVTLHTGGKAYTLRQPIGRLEQRLDPARWVRVNRSELIPIDQIARLEPWFHGEFEIVLRNGARARWTRRYVGRAAALFPGRGAQSSDAGPARPG